MNFFSDEHAGIFTFLVGIIVVVMTAVGLSLLADRRFAFSSGVADLKKDIESEAGEIADLRIAVRDRGIKLAESAAATKAREDELRSADAQNRTLRARKSELVETKFRLKIAIPSIEQDFASYRAAYRQKTWATSVGEELGTLNIKGGRTYNEAVITRVTDVGLEIRHDHGIARVQAPDLDAKIQDRFQWDDEERRLRLKEEQEQMAKMIARSAAAREATEATAAAETPAPSTRDLERDELLRVRNLVLAWRSKVATLNSEYSEASMRGSYGSQSSVPGSLETWRAKQTRIGKELARARGSLAKAKAELSVISPDDRLLRIPEGF